MSTRSRLAALMAALCLALSACAAPAPQPQPTAAPVLSPPPSEAAAPLPSPPVALEEPEYPEVRVYLDSLLAGKGYRVGDAVYLSPQAVCAAFGVDLTLELGAEVRLSAPGLELSASPGREYVLANGRYLYVPYGYYVFHDQLYLPADAVERLLGLQVECDPEGLLAQVRGSRVAFIAGGENYYETVYPSEDIFWLSRIIYAESHGEPFAGMIGVGNVVLNRVESRSFPSTIYTVIYDREFAIQFEPIATGGVYEDPDEQALIAAYLCLEGYSTVGDSLYFVNPDKSANPWFEEALVPTVTIGLHHFYTDPALNGQEDDTDA